MKKVIGIIAAFILLSVLIACFDTETEPQSTEETQNTYGFKYAWCKTTKREKTYFLYDPDQNILIRFSYRGSQHPSSSYSSYKTEGNLSSGLFILDPDTGERRSEYYRKNKDGYQIVSGDSRTFCSSCTVSSVVKLLVNDFNYTP